MRSAKKFKNRHFVLCSEKVRGTKAAQSRGLVDLPELAAPGQDCVTHSHHHSHGRVVGAPGTMKRVAFAPSAQDLLVLYSTSIFGAQPPPLAGPVDPPAPWNKSNAIVGGF
jgi:hypothetical protein